MFKKDKSLIFITTIYSITYAMDPAPKQLLWNTQSYQQDYGPNELSFDDLIQQYSFNNLTVLDYSGSEVIAQHIAKTAALVHCNSSNLTDTAIEKKNKEYSHVKNLVFTKPKESSYDYIIIANPMDLRYRNAENNLNDCYSLLKTKGKILGFGFIQPNDCIVQKTIDILYPDIYEIVPEQKRIQCGLKPIAIQGSIFCCYEDLKGFRTLFKVKSHQPKPYNVIIEDKKKYKDFLKGRFVDLVNVLIKKFEVPREKIELLEQKFINLVIQQLYENSNGDIVHPVTLTTIVWSRMVIKIRSLFPLTSSETIPSSSGNESSES